MKKESAGATALHAHVGDHHAVGVLSLRVFLVEDTSGWFAQGLDIDYSASGANVDEVKKNFEDGFCKTVHEHLVMHGSIERLLKPADQDAWKEFYESPKGLRFSSIQLYRTDDTNHSVDTVSLPFDSIQFMQRLSSREMAREAIPA